MKTLRIVLLGIFVVAALIYLNSVFIPKPQTTQAAWFTGTQQYACGQYLTVLLTPNSETCNGSNTGNIGSYQSSIKVTAASGSLGAYAVHWKWGSYWCATEDPHAPCVASNAQNIQYSSGVDGLTGNNSAYVVANSPVNKPNGQFAGMTCGYYQNDFAFYVTNNDNPNRVICGISLDNPGANNNNASWCHTGTSCVAPTPPQPIQHMACQDNACRLVPGPGANQCSSNNDCLPEGHLIVKKHVINDDGGTESASDFTMYVKDVQTGDVMNFPGNETGTTILVSPTQTYTVYEGDHQGYTETSSGSCSGIIARGQTATCTIINDDEPGASPTPSVTPTTTPIPTPSGCTANCNNTTVNVTQSQTQQQQQQQAVLGASVAPASNASSLPSTGAGADVLLGLLGLLPIGFKLRKLI